MMRFRNNGTNDNTSLLFTLYSVHRAGQKIDFLVNGIVSEISIREIHERMTVPD
jgi:hypothetical protein